MDDVCPDALFLNYTNPMAMLVRAVAEASAIPTVGLCHSVYWTVAPRSPSYLGVPLEEVDALSGGVNHLAFILRLEHRGRDLYPDLRGVRRGAARSPTTTSSAPTCTAGSATTRPSRPSTTPSTTRGSSPRATRSSAFHVPIGEYLARVARNLDEYAETKRMLDAGEPFEIERSGEYAAVIINAIDDRRAGPDRRQRDERRGPDRRTSPATPASRCPALVDGLGVHPTPIGALPPQCAAYIRPAVDMQELTVRAALDQDRDPVYHAVHQDPIVQAQLTLDEAWRLTDELIAAEAEWLPAWLGGIDATEARD